MRSKFSCVRSSHDLWARTHMHSLEGTLHLSQSTRCSLDIYQHLYILSAHSLVSGCFQLPIQLILQPYLKWHVHFVGIFLSYISLQLPCSDALFCLLFCPFWCWACTITSMTRTLCWLNTASPSINLHQSRMCFQSSPLTGRYCIVLYCIYPFL